jgi:hypothetical protein
LGAVPAQAWVTLIVGSFATIGALATWQQRYQADRRSEWWRRTQWAIERTFSNNETEGVLGWNLLAAQVGSSLATRDDADVVQVVAEHAALSEEREEDSFGYR